MIWVLFAWLVITWLGLLGVWVIFRKKSKELQIAERMNDRILRGEFVLG